MYLEVLGFAGIIVVVLAFFSETLRLPVLGIGASVLLLISGLWVLIDDVQVRTAETVTGSTILQADNVTTVQNLTTAYTYSDVPPLTFGSTTWAFSWVLGLVLTLISIMGFLYYTLEQGG